MIEITDKAKCCGCTACKVACPTGAIEMEQDKEGFSYPCIDNSKCIKCNKCNRVCPIINKSNETAFSRKVYICQNTDDNIRFDSTSGGVFSALACYVIDRNGYVFGAEFDNKWRVVHGVGSSLEDLGRFRGSKYVQSHLGDTFKDVKRLLDDDKWVLFTGTPCQVEGLVSYLNKQYEKLILMDIVCFSISSPGVWKTYLEHLEKTGKIDISKISEIKFRDKTKYGYEYTLMTFYDNNSKVLYSSGPESNQMLRSFVSNTSVRPACYSCQFKKVNRVSDFTAWDCYNVYKYKKEMDDNRGTSHVMIHTKKAQQIVDEINGKYLVMKPVELDKAVESEPAMIECAVPSVNREAFFECIADGEDCFDYFFQETPKVKIEKTLRVILSKIGLYSYFKRRIKG